MRVLQGNSVVLMMHRVVSDKSEADLPHNNPLCIDQASFAGLLNWLQQYFQLVPLEEALRPEGGKPRLALTFDDGWRDNLTHAFPVLQEMGIPASIFLSTGYIGQPRGFWWESVGQRIWNEPETIDRACLDRELAGYGLDAPDELFSTNRTLTRSRQILAFLEQLKRLAPCELNAIASDLFHQGPGHAMSWHEVSALEASGLVRFGPHGHDHYILTQLEADACMNDMRRSHEELHSHCRFPLPVYCYPNGNHDLVVRKNAAKLGYRYGLTTEAGLISSGNDPLILPRIDVSQQAASHKGLMAWRIRQGALL